MAFGSFLLFDGSCCFFFFSFPSLCILMDNNHNVMMVDCYLQCCVDLSSVSSSESLLIKFQCLHIFGQIEMGFNTTRNIKKRNSPNSFTWEIWSILWNNPRIFSYYTQKVTSWFLFISCVKLRKLFILRLRNQLQMHWMAAALQGFIWHWRVWISRKRCSYLFFSFLFDKLRSNLNGTLKINLLISSKHSISIYYKIHIFHAIVWLAIQ